MSTFGVVTVSYSPLRKFNSDASEMVSQLLFGEGVELLSIEGSWAHIRCLTDNYEGYLDSKQIALLTAEESKQWESIPKTRMWNLQNILVNTQINSKITIYRGSLIPKDSTFQLGNVHYVLAESVDEIPANTSAETIADSYLGTPYLWGGRSMHGIDCSGFTQLLATFKGISLPRDASQQVNQGAATSFSARKAGDVAFFENENGKIIHVGVLKDEDTIIHASGWVREDKFDGNGIYRVDMQKYTHKFRTLRRIF